jgi:hypothetical protein
MYLNSGELFCGGFNLSEKRQDLCRNLDRGQMSSTSLFSAAAAQVRGVVEELPLGSRPHPMKINDQHGDIVYLSRLGSITRPSEHFV